MSTIIDKIVELTNNYVKSIRNTNFIKKEDLKFFTRL